MHLACFIPEPSCLGTRWILAVRILECDTPTSGPTLPQERGHLKANLRFGTLACARRARVPACSTGRLRVPGLSVEA